MQEITAYATPNSNTGGGYRAHFERAFRLGTKYGPKSYKKYVEDKKYAERMKRIKQGQQIENQRLADASSKKNMTGSRKANNMLVDKSSMVVTGKTKTKRQKIVKVSAKFRAGVKQVLSGDTARGTYTTLIQGYIGSAIVNGGSNWITFADLAQSQRGVLLPGSLNPVGSRTLWNCLALNNPGAAPTALTLSGFNYFTPAKVLDAASVLFNSKTIGDPYLRSGNLSEVLVGATGIPQTSLPTLKINIIGSSVVWRMKNVSNRVVNVEIWECMSTLKYGNSPPLQSLYGQDQVFNQTANDNPVRYVFGGLARTNYYYEQGFDPVAVAKKYNGFPWTWKKRTMVMQPDETCIHTIRGPSGVLDFRKLVSADALGNHTVNLDCMLKGFSVGCIVSVVGDQVYKPTVTGATGGRDVYTSATAAQTRLGMPISVEIEEKYRIAVPEIAGYITQNGAAGSTQQLNMRKNRFIFNNLIASQASTDTPATGYVVSSEENFVTQTTAGTADQ